MIGTVYQGWTRAGARRFGGAGRDAPAGRRAGASGGKDGARRPAAGADRCGWQGQAAPSYDASSSSASPSSPSAGSGSSISSSSVALISPFWWLNS